ncbi:uncharacterized protein LOC109716551 isoform X2 [Ananas comosus]|uniref:Uncharacterized protein LOC109716551 isoform X2 n=1 Tax=Ananas comosus TaxID=4615 RepID=A0A6P5FVX5_ANACO|nr:uncharacterized protein LOC109716551 isoform X2 [Ananas comosus]
MEDPGPYDDMVRVIEASFSRIKWRLRPRPKRRLLNDILFLCTGLRPVVLVDYGGIMPKLHENLCALLDHARKESAILRQLKVMVIDDMAYIIHDKELAEHVSWSLSRQQQQQFVFLDIEQNPPNMLSSVEDSELISEFVSIQKLFSSVFPVKEANRYLPADEPPSMVTAEKELMESKNVNVAYISDSTEKASEDINDLCTFLHNARITLPSLNGWLLGYPVTYLFSREQGEKAMRNLSDQSLHIFRVYVSRKQKPGERLTEYELLSFTVPCCLSTWRDKEPWMEAFLARMTAKVARSKHIWASMRVEIENSQSHSQTIVL